MAEKRPTRMDFDGWEAMTEVEPQPTYYRLLTEKPVQRVEGGVMLTRMADIQAVTKTHGVLGSGGLGPSMGGARPLIPLDLDGPDHTTFRKLLDPLFAPRKVAVWEPVVRHLAGELVDEFAGEGTVDAYAEFCAPLPTRIFLTIMGIPLSELDYFMHFKDRILRSRGADRHDLDARRRRQQEASVECYSWFEANLAERDKKGEPGDDLIGWLMTAEVDGHRLTRDEILDITYLLMIAGLDTVTSSLGCQLSWLARHPDERRAVVAHPERWGSAVEELMRYESPVTAGMRYAETDVTLPDGEVIPARSSVVVSWAAANLDPAVFPDPLRCDLERSPNPHIAFASGFHRCLGSHLARLEMRSALDEWHRRIPDYEVEPGHELTYPMGVRTPEPLPLVW